MRKICTLLLLLAGLGSQAQAQHEVKWNIANTIGFASVEVGYEYIFDNNQSFGAEILINDVYNMSIGRQVRDFNTNSFQLTYNYYISGREDSFVVSPLMKFRTGSYQKTPSDPKVNMDSFTLGVQAGYKWILNDKFVIGPYASIGRNFSGTIQDEFHAAVEFHAGFGLGLRF